MRVEIITETLTGYIESVAKFGTLDWVCCCKHGTFRVAKKKKKKAKLTTKFIL
jgi:hypothetical protein